MLTFGTTDIRYLRSDTADNRYRYPILRILCLLCLQCKAPFTLCTVPYIDARTWTHSDAIQTALLSVGTIVRCRSLPYSDAVCVNAAVEISVLNYNVAVRSVNGVIIGMLVIM